ncbi:MAG: response regulator, partial [Candidatus Fimimonas sp.]
MTPKKQILVVEDNALNRELLVAILEDDYDTLQAENGLEALESLKQHKDIALILLDVMMPVMDGFTFLDNVKQDEELSLIPVIVTTQSEGEADEVEALARGATDFVPKPYKPQVILHRIASIIKLRETAAMVNQFQYDRLTGLFSREFFLQKARDVLNENPDEDYTIVCSNIENFKLYNDAYGRQGGDDLLKNVAERIREIVGNNGIYGRYGA